MRSKYEWLKDTIFSTKDQIYLFFPRFFTVVPLNKKSFGSNIPFSPTLHCFPFIIMDSLNSFISKQNDPAVDYVAAIRKNLDNNNTKESIQKLFIIPPFTKTHFSSEQTLNAAYNQCVDAIMATIPMQSKGKITITKTWTKVREKSLHTLLLIGPQECQTHFNHLTLHGIQLLGKTIFPTMHQTRSLNLYPKRYNVKINQLPFVCSEAVLIELLKLPEDVQIIESLHRYN